MVFPPPSKICGSPFYPRIKARFQRPNAEFTSPLNNTIRQRARCDSSKYRLTFGLLAIFNRRMLRIVLVVLLLSMFCGLTPAQQDVPGFQDEVGVTIVNLYASVRDNKGRPVYSLQQEDFSLYIN